MLKRSKKFLSMMVAVMLVLFTLAGCGSQVADQSGTGTDTAAVTTTEAAPASTQAEAPEQVELQPVTITFSEQDDPNSGDPTWNELVKAFMDKYPAVTVKVEHKETEGQRTDWQNAVLAGAGPEVISCPHDNAGLFAASSTAMELDNFFTPEFYAQFSPKDINDYKVNGKIYGIPYKNGNALTLVYNKKYVQEAPKTMDELVAKAKELTKGTEFYGLVFDMVEPFFSVPFLGGYGGKVFDETGKPTLDTDAVKNMYQLLYDMKYTWKIIPKEGNTDVANGLFLEGKAAMIINGPWFYNQAKDKGIDFGIARIPQLTGGTWPAPYTGAKIFMVNPNIKDDNTKLAVQRFIEFLCTPEASLKLAKASTEIPTNLEAQKDPYVTSDPWLKAFADQMTVGTPMPYQPEMRVVWDTLRNIQGQVLGGSLKPEDAPKAAQEAVLKGIKDQFGKTY